MDEQLHIDPPPAVARISKRTLELGFGMASEPLTGAWLRTLAASKPGGRLLELGTGTGLVTAWLLDGMDSSSELISVDVDPIPQMIAREELGEDPRLTLVTEDAISFLKRQPRAGYDLVFADAMPGKYEGLDEALQVVKVGGFYVVDDMLPQKNWPEGHAAKASALLATLAKRPDFVMVPMAWASGLVMAVRQAPAGGHTRT